MRKSDSAVNLPVIAVEASSNTKTGLCSATYVSGKTCPDSCPFKKNGCYGESGHVGIVARRVTSSRTEDPAAIARLEAAVIDALGAQLDLRLHVYGEFANIFHALAVREAAKRYVTRGQMVGRDLKVWSYTHNWRDIPRSSFGDISILASVETPDAAMEAMKAGYAPALLVSEFDKDTPHQMYSTNDVFTMVPCPAQTKGRKCVDCRLCLDDARLRENRLVIGFRPNRNNSRRKALKVLETIESGEG